jgi:hypothetical protein
VAEYLAGEGSTKGRVGVVGGKWVYQNLGRQMDTISSIVCSAITTSVKSAYHMGASKNLTNYNLYWLQVLNLDL